MKFVQSKSLEEIASILGSPFKGNANMVISGINEIHRVEVGDIAFVDHPKYYDKALNSAATVVLINKEVDIPEGKGIIVCEDPFKSFNYLLNYFDPFVFPEFQQHPDTRIGNNTKIHPSVAIGRNVSIGDNTLIFPNVTIGDNVTIGNNVIIQPGVVLGSFGFYYKNRPDHFERLNSCGTVIIEDFVEIGANCTIDKGVTAETKIGRGTKIDNLVQIGHDTVIGNKCLIAAGCGIAGCITIGNEVTVWGQVGMSSGISIGDKAVIQGQTGVTKSIEGGKVYFGTPVEESRQKLKEMAMIRRLPSLFEKINSND